MLGSLIAIISIRTALAIMSIRTARAWLRAAARAPRSVPGRLRALILLKRSACRMAHAHVHAGSCRGVYTQEKHRSEIAGTLRQMDRVRERVIWNLLCHLCVGRGGEPPSVREKATAHTRTTMAVPVVCVERAVFRSLSSGGVINISFQNESPGRQLQTKSTPHTTTTMYLARLRKVRRYPATRAERSP